MTSKQRESDGSGNVVKQGPGANRKQPCEKVNFRGKYHRAWGGFSPSHFSPVS
jgi:NADPH:quinone reductase-like Zn-dependent oxidoreductase